MPLLLDVQAGGEKFLAFAKTKLRQWKQQMVAAGVGSFAKTIFVDSGEKIYINSVDLGHGQFRDRIRITAEALLWRALKSMHSVINLPLYPLGFDHFWLGTVSQDIESVYGMRRDLDWSRSRDTMAWLEYRAAYHSCPVNSEGISFSVASLGGAFTLSTVTAVSHCTAVKSGSSVDFVPEPGYSGEATFTFTTKHNGVETVPALVTVYVGGIPPADDVTLHIVRGAVTCNVPHVAGLVTDTPPVNQIYYGGVELIVEADNVPRSQYRASNTPPFVISDDGKRVIARSAVLGEAFVVANLNAAGDAYDVTRVALPSGIASRCTAGQTTYVVPTVAAPYGQTTMVTHWQSVLVNPTGVYNPAHSYMTPNMSTETADVVGMAFLNFRSATDAFVFFVAKTLQSQSTVFSQYSAAADTYWTEILSLNKNVASVLMNYDFDANTWVEAKVLSNSYNELSFYGAGIGGASPAGANLGLWERPEGQRWRLGLNHGGSWDVIVTDPLVRGTVSEFSISLLDSQNVIRPVAFYTQEGYPEVDPQGADVVLGTDVWFNAVPDASIGGGWQSSDTVGSGLFITPDSAPVVSRGENGALNSGSYGYKVTYVTAIGETVPSAATTGTADTPLVKIDLTLIPTGPTSVIARRLYRTPFGGGLYKFLTEITDNMATVYTDNAPDSSLGALAPVVGTTAINPPTLAPSGSPASGGAMPVGDYYYAVTYVTAAGETTIGSESALVLAVPENGRVGITAVPVGQTGVTGRRVYRRAAAYGSSYVLVKYLEDNTTTSFTDSAAVGTTAPPLVNGTTIAAPGARYLWRYVKADGNAEDVVMHKRGFIDRSGSWYATADGDVYYEGVKRWDSTLRPIGVTTLAVICPSSDKPARFLVEATRVGVLRRGIMALAQTGPVAPSTELPPATASFTWLPETVILRPTTPTQAQLDAEMLRIAVEAGYASVNDYLALGGGWSLSDLQAMALVNLSAAPVDVSLAAAGAAPDECYPSPAG